MPDLTEVAERQVEHGGTEREAERGYEIPTAFEIAGAHLAPPANSLYRRAAFIERLARRRSLPGYLVAMAEHNITVAVPKPLELGRQDVVFVINIDGKKAGELHVSKGGLDWWGRSKKTDLRTKTWEQLRDFMES